VCGCIYQFLFEGGFAAMIYPKIYEYKLYEGD
jgi:hypothetical protein